ncbi:MAG: MFS transporter [Candidatus Methanodesulfokora washburnensis]|jgi:EmrB/QacA subfamily drug resistance transporter
MQDGKMLHVLSVTTIASFLAGINARIVVVGLPLIAHFLGADVEQALWFTQAYMLGSTAIQLIVGRLSDIFGRVNLFSLGFGLFSIAALLCGFSWNPFNMIAFRFFQGIGAAFLMSLSLTIIADNAPRERVGTWIGVNQVAFRLGSLLGLTLGGVIIDLMGWRWVFWIYVPLGLVSIFWSKRRLEEVFKPRERPRIDSFGFITFTVSISLILLSLTYASYPNSSRLSWILALAGLMTLSLFILWELRFPSPALDLRIFRIWQFSGGIIAQLLYAIAFGATTILLVVYLEIIRGLSPSDTGLLLVPYELSFLVFGVAGGKLSDRYGYAPVTIIGLALSSASLYLMSGLRMDMPLYIAVIYMLLFGMGTGLFVTPNASSIVMSAPPERRGVASSMRTISFNLGFAISLNLAILVMTQFIPYNIASKLITEDYSGIANIARDLQNLSIALSQTFKVQSIIMAVAIIFSFSRSMRD